MPPNVKKWILVLAGVLAGHQMAHAFAHDHANAAAHGYLTTASLVILPVAGLVLLDLAWRETLVGVRVVRIRDLLLAQAAIFFAQELSEAVVVGTAPISAVTDPILWLGMAAQVAVAGSMLSFIALGRRFLAGWGWSRPPERLDSLRSILTAEPSRPAHRLIATRLPAPRAPPVIV